MTGMESGTGTITLAPVRGGARIEVLDVLRGIAILGIFYMNIPFMAAPVLPTFVDIRANGWSLADARSWAVIQIVWEGTQRCLLEYLFGAGMMVLAARAMEPDGPVAVADLYYRRNLWLLGFGLVDVFLLLWPGDILHIYALAALFLFPFRRLAPRWLVALGLIFALATAVGGVVEYVGRTTLIERVHVAEAKQAAHRPLVAVDKAALANWNKKLHPQLPPAMRPMVAQERRAHTGGLIPYAGFYWTVWTRFIFGKGGTLMGVAEAFSAMLIGVALWKWGVIQGGRSTRFYVWTLLAAYGFGITARVVGVMEIETFRPIPKTIWATSELARLAVGLGHVALVNLAIRTALGRTLLNPFRAAGRIAFSLYFCEQIIGLQFLFSPWGLGLWGRYSYGGQTAIATLVIVFLLVAANVWARFFVSGPLEWLWRTLAYLRRQPFRRHRGDRPVGILDTGPLPA